MGILTICGSTAPNAANRRLLAALAHRYPSREISAPWRIERLPLFGVSQDHHPAILKNALEWLTTSGELSNKAVIAITYTPAPPRGAEAMTSLIWSLKALEARVLAQCPLYQNQLSVADDHSLRGLESIELVDELISLLP